MCNIFVHFQPLTLPLTLVVPLYYYGLAVTQVRLGDFGAAFTYKGAMPISG